MHVKYFFKKGEHNLIFDMTTVADTAFELNKYPHSIDYIKKQLPKSKSNITFRVTKMEKLKYLGESFAYE